jgi:hypothetical protein
MSAESALVIADVSRFKTDKVEYDRFMASYIMIKPEADWKISTWIVHDSKETLKTVRFQV